MPKTGLIRRGNRNPWAAGLALCLALTTGCATTVPYTGQGPHPQLERGAPVLPIDFLGNVLSLIHKLLLFTWKFNSHSISPATEDTLVRYLGNRSQPALQDTKFRLNQYRPVQDLSRLIHNPHIAWPYKIFPGLFTTLFTDVLLPGRLFPWGDYYNPFTNTVHLYSNHPAIALHEAGHAYDFSQQRWKGTYAFLRLLPFVDLYQEFKATDEAIDYLIIAQDRTNELKAYKVLYPAYGMYVGQYIFFPFGYIALIFGHIYGRSVARERAALYQQLSPLTSTMTTPTYAPPSSSPVPVSP